MLPQPNQKTIWLEYVGDKTPPILNKGSSLFEFKPFPQYKDKLLVSIPAAWREDLIDKHYRTIVEYDPSSPDEFEKCMKHYCMKNRADIERWWREADEQKANEPVVIPEPRKVEVVAETVPVVIPDEEVVIETVIVPDDPIVADEPIVDQAPQKQEKPKQVKRK